MKNNKQCVSIRLKPSDIDKIERIAARLGARNSDVIRYAIKTTLTRLMDLHDSDTQGFRLLPILLNHCNELNRHFDLDADRLDEIINTGIERETDRVDRADIELLALCGLSPHYIQSRLQELTGETASTEEIPKLLHEYLLEKYRKRQKEDGENSLQSLQ